MSRIGLLAGTGWEHKVEPQRVREDPVSRRVTLDRRRSESTKVQLGTAVPTAHSEALKLGPPSSTGAYATF